MEALVVPAAARDSSVMAPASSAAIAAEALVTAAASSPRLSPRDMFALASTRHPKEHQNSHLKAAPLM